MSVCFMLIGLPCSGKSTFVDKMLVEQPLLSVVSMDKYIEKEALDKNIVYNDVFSNKSKMKELEKEFKNEIRYLLENKKPFIWDQMNLTEESRRGKLARLMSYKYEVIAFEFKIPKEVWLERINNRSVNQSHKIFSDDFYNEIEKSFESVNDNENFKEVFVINENGTLIKKVKNPIANFSNSIK